MNRHGNKRTLLDRVTVQFGTTVVFNPTVVGASSMTNCNAARGANSRQDWRANRRRGAVLLPIHLGEARISGFWQNTA